MDDRMRPVTFDAARPVPDPSLASDDALVDAVRSGRSGLFEELVKRHNQRLFRAVRSIVPNDHEAEDVVQHAYLRAFEHLDQFAGHAKFSTWLTRIAVHEALARVQRLRRSRALERDHHDAGWQSGGPHAATPESQVFGAELRRLLEAALDHLDDAYRTVIVLRDVEGLSSLEIAESIGVSELLVRVRLHRARSQLRTLLGDAMDLRAVQPYAFAGERCARITQRVMASIRERAEQRV
jgi:RNA polymerase sigma-70 factor (ECF subfamily)